MHWFDSLVLHARAVSWVDFIAVAAMVLLAGLGIWVSVIPQKGGRWPLVCIFLFLGVGAIAASLWQVTDAKIDAAKEKAESEKERKDQRGEAELRDSQLSLTLVRLEGEIEALGKTAGKEQVKQLRAEADALAAQLEWRLSPRQSDDLHAALLSMKSRGIIGIGAAPKTDTRSIANQLRDIFSQVGWDTVMSGGTPGPGGSGVVCTVAATSPTGNEAADILRKLPGFTIRPVAGNQFFEKGAVDIECFAYDRPGPKNDSINAALGHYPQLSARAVLRSWTQSHSTRLKPSPERRKALSVNVKATNRVRGVRCGILFQGDQSLYKLTSSNGRPSAIGMKETS